MDLVLGQVRSGLVWSGLVHHAASQHRSPHNGADARESIDKYIPSTDRFCDRLWATLAADSRSVTWQWIRVHGGGC